MKKQAKDWEVEEVCCLIADDRIMEAFTLLNNRAFTDDQECEMIADVTQMIWEEEGPLNFMCIFGKDESVGWYLVSGGGDSLVKGSEAQRNENVS